MPFRSQPHQVEEEMELVHEEDDELLQRGHKVRRRCGFRTRMHALCWEEPEHWERRAVDSMPILRKGCLMSRPSDSRAYSVWLPFGDRN